MDLDDVIDLLARKVRDLDEARDLYAVEGGDADELVVMEAEYLLWRDVLDTVRQCKPGQEERP